MKQTKNQPQATKLVKRLLALVLCVAIIGTGINVFNGQPITSVQAATTEISETFENDQFLGYSSGCQTGLSDTAYKGNSSLLVSARNNFWETYNYDVSKYAGSKIDVSAFMRVDQNDLSGKIILKTTLDGADNYEWVGLAELKKGEFTKVSGSKEIPAGATAIVYFVTCLTADPNSEGTEDFFLDDVTISGEESGVQAITKKPYINEKFNKVKVDKIKGFTFGAPTFSIVKSGKGKALKVSDRTANYFAYAYDAKDFGGNTISLSAKIRAVGQAKDAETVFNATIKTTTADGDDYKQIASVSAKGNKFATLKNRKYEVPAGCSAINIYFEGPENVTYIIDDIKIKVVGEYKDAAYADTSSYPILKDLYKDSFKVGVSCEAISHWNNTLSEIGNPAKENLIKAQFNSITFGNELKPDYNMGYNSPDATETYLPYVVNPAAKELLDWAEANGLPVRGHTLIWHSQCPDAVFCKNYTPVKSNGTDLDAGCMVDRKVLIARMKSYIDSAMKYMYENGYADTIYAWDVVNEAVEPAENKDGLRNSYWYQIIGSDFVYLAFKYTREACNKYSVEYAANYGIDPADEAALAKIQPKLFYNDYNEDTPAKCDAIIRLTTKPFAGHNIYKEGYIDGIGLQGHLSDNADLDNYMECLKKYAAAVDEVQITELDIKKTTAGVNADYYQARCYKNLFDALVAAKKDGANITGVTVWGLTDDNSWLKETSPLLFNGDLSAKKAFEVLTGAELGEPVEVPVDHSDMNATFEKDTDINLFTVRGGGNIAVQNNVKYKGKNALLCSGRTDSWNGVSFDVTRFIGETIVVTGWVKTTAKEAKISADINNLWPNIAVADTSSGKWTKITGEYLVPADMTSLNLYFETTEGTDDFYVDNVTVKLK